MMAVHRETRLFIVLLVVSLQAAVCAQPPLSERLPAVPERIPAPVPFSDQLPLGDPAKTVPPLRRDPPVRKLTTADSLIRRFEDIERNQQLRLKRIQEKIEQLKQIVITCKSAPETSPASTPLPTVVAEPPLQDTRLSVQEVRQEDTNSFHEEQNGPSGGEPASSPLIPITPTVDSLALANNLFAQGKVGEARPIYEKLIRLRQEPSDFLWIQYQLASCYRIEGQLKDAVKLYRLVAGTKENNYWKRRALWWLDYLSRSQALFQRQQRLQEKLDTLRKTADEVQKQ